MLKILWNKNISVYSGVSEGDIIGTLFIDQLMTSLYNMVRANLSAYDIKKIIAFMIKFYMSGLINKLSQDVSHSLCNVKGSSPVIYCISAEG